MLRGSEPVNNFFRPGAKGDSALHLFPVFLVIADLGRFANVEREPSSTMSADRGAAVETSDVDGPDDKVRDLGGEILRSCRNSFGCRRVSGLVKLAELTDAIDPKPRWAS
jgi:hypothetical protein